MAALRGRLISFNSTPYTAVVRLDLSQGGTLADVAVSRGIPAAEMTAGRRLLIDTGDHHHPGDLVVIAVW